MLGCSHPASASTASSRQTNATMADWKRCSIRMNKKIHTASFLQGVFANIHFMKRTGSFFISGAPQMCLVFLQSSIYFPHISLVIFSSYLTREWFLLMHTFIWQHLVERRRATRHWRVSFNVWLKRALEWQETLSVLIGKKKQKMLWLLMRKTPRDLTVPFVHWLSVHEAPHSCCSAAVPPTLCSPLWEADTSKVPERIYPPGLIQSSLPLQRDKWINVLFSSFRHAPYGAQHITLRSNVD